MINLKWIAALLTLFVPLPTMAQQTLWQQKFDTREALQAWWPNSDVDELRIENGVLHCRGIGIDPLMVLKAHLQIQANAFQAVEFQMKADHDGTAQLFWSGTTEGKYGGFSGDKRTEMPIRGDSQFHVYRALPFWQKEGRIIQLRFDPYQGSRFEIAWIRIVQLPQPVISGAPALTPLTGVHLNRNRDGQKLTLDAPGGFAGGVTGNIDASQNTVVSLRIISSGPTSASFGYGTTDAFGMQQQRFNLIADGRSHWYNLDMLNASGWQGTLCAAALQPGSRTSDSIVLQELVIGKQPRGPADIRIQRFLTEEARPRAGLPFHIAARITNAGAASQQTVTPLLHTDAGMKLIASEPPTTKGPLRFGEEREFRWTVLARTTGSHTARLDIAGAQAANIIAITARPPLRASYPPPPVALKQATGVEVGAYYFPGWKTAGQWAPITRFPERRPVLGWYREGDPQVIDWQIKWALEHGITFFAYDWYWQQGVQQLDHALNDGLFKSKYADSFKFCLLWANHNAAGSSSVEDCVAAARFWKRAYFSRKNYLRINGKPAIIIFSPYRFREDLGSEGVRAAFAAVRKELTEDGVSLIACVNSPAEAKVAQLETYDAITCYNWPGLGMHGAEKAAPYSDLLPAYVRQWQSLIENTSLPLLTPLCGGWDNRPWAGDAAMVRTNRTPALFQKHVADALHFVKTHPQSTLPLLLAEAWNEWGEGSYIEPQQQFGFGYLDAIRDALVPHSGLHTDLTPEDVGATAPQTKFEDTSRADWSFAHGTSGWDNGMQTSAVTVQDGALTATTTGTDPAFFGPPMQVFAERHPVFTLRYRASTQLPPATGQDLAQLFWQTRTASESEATSVRFPLITDGEWHDVRIALSSNPRWRGIITRLRFDPCDRAGVQIQLSRIGLLAK